MAGAPKKAPAAILASAIAALLAAAVISLYVRRLTSPAARRSLDSLLPAPTAAVAALSVAAALGAVGVLICPLGIRRRIRLRLFWHKVGLSRHIVFLKNSADGAWPLNAWIEKRREEAVEPDLEVIDAHHNLFDLRTEPKFGGLEPEEVAALFSVASPSEITEYYKQAWSKEPETFYGAAAGPSESADPALRRGLALLRKHSFTFDTYVFHEQLGQMADLARSFPDQVIIVDHAALPLGLGSYTPKGTFPIWEKGVRELARASKNVYMKLSGFGMCLVGLRHNELPVPPSSDQLAADWGPYFLAALDAFGAERCLFGTHFPVDKVSCDYTIMWNAYKKIVQDLPVEQKMLLFRDNAKRIYRL